MSTATPDRRPSAIVTIGGYLLLFALGLLEGLLGALWYAWTLGPVPVAALGWAVLNGSACFVIPLLGEVAPPHAPRAAPATAVL